MNKKSILCIGAGYVGGPTMAMIAAKCPDYTVTVADINEQRIAGWNSESMPIYEPGLYDVVKQARGRNLFFTTDVVQGLKDAYIIFVSVNTPTKTFGAGAGKAALCERTGADVSEVSYAVSRDSRIGSKFLRPGVGFGGSCFKKDILNLVYLCEQYNLHEVANYWEQVVLMNDYQERRFANRIAKAMFNTLSGKRIALFGFAFKADTGDTRESPAIYIAKMLIEEHAKLAIHDPQALPNARLDMKGYEDSVEYCDDPYAAAKGAHAIAVITDWKCFAELDYKRLFDSMEKPAFIFDGRNILDHKKLFEIGFEVYPLGRSKLSHMEHSI